MTCNRPVSDDRSEVEVLRNCGQNETEKLSSNQKVASSIPCRSVLEQDTEPLISPDVQCAISVNVKCVYILVSCFG